MKRKPGPRGQPERLPSREHDEDLRQLCPVAPGWRAVFVRQRPDGRWALETEPVLGLVLVRSAIRHEKRDRALDRVAHSVQGLTPSTLPRFGRRPGEVGTAEDLALPEHAFLGYLPPGGLLRDGDRFVRLAEAHVRRHAGGPGALVPPHAPAEAVDAPAYAEAYASAVATSDLPHVAARWTSPEEREAWIAREALFQYRLRRPVPVDREEDVPAFASAGEEEDYWATHVPGPHLRRVFAERGTPWLDDDAEEAGSPMLQAGCG